MKLLRKILKNLLGRSSTIPALALASSLFAAAPAFANAPVPGSLSQPAPRAELDRDQDQDQAQYAAYRPGVWRKLAESETDPDNISLAALMRAERATGAVFCKMRRADGWYTNFIDCSKRRNVNRMQDEPNGVMMPTVEDPNDLMVYDLSPRRHDRQLSAAIRTAHVQMVAMAETPSYRLAAMGIPERIELAPLDIRPPQIEVASLPPLPSLAPLPEPRPVQTRPVRPAPPTVVLASTRPQAVRPAARRPAPTPAPVQMAANDAPAAVLVPVAAPVVPEQTVRPQIVLASVQADPAPVIFTASNDRQAATDPMTALRDRFDLAAYGVTTDSLRSLRDRFERGEMRAADKTDDGKKPDSDQRQQFALASTHQPGWKGKGGGKKDSWVTPGGRRMQLEVFSNGRFRAAPAQLAA